ncbi:hypothetical protein R1sor_025631 [Riccia sorocarpa]|uniref:Uncharacterized protein n=1 Tax=Riccia sorocarpa TaxID=122646 RepID=A0ABD3G9N4_9MARC
MAPKKRPPQAPPAAAPWRKKRTPETTQQPTDAGPSGEYLVKFEHTADTERHVRWCYVTGDQRRSALRRRNSELTASGLFAALDLPVHRPHISSCLEFIHSAVTVNPREGVSPLDLPMEATVRDRTVRLDAALVRAAFVLPAASMEIKRQVRHSSLWTCFGV